MAAAGAGGEADSAAAQPAEEALVQYVVLRKDLRTGLGWPLGSVVAQGCHAALAAVQLHYAHPDTQRYLAADNLPRMRKVVLEVEGERQLLALAERLTEAEVGHHLWMEQPENIPTCIACRPYSKADVQVHFKKCKLAK